MTETVFIFLIFMCGIMGFALLCFVLYHCYLISQGQTTNERVKRNDFIAQLKDEIKLKEKIIKNFGGVDSIPEEFEHAQGKTIKKDMFLKYLDEDRQELEYLKKGSAKKGFWENFKIIMKA
jgi:hypothetical protein